jgi:hypothetical protein
VVAVEQQGQLVPGRHALADAHQVDVMPAQAAQRLQLVVDQLVAEPAGPLQAQADEGDAVAAGAGRGSGRGAVLGQLVEAAEGGHRHVHVRDARQQAGRARDAERDADRQVARDVLHGKDAVGHGHGSGHRTRGEAVALLEGHADRREHLVAPQADVVRRAGAHREAHIPMRGAVIDAAQALLEPVQRIGAAGSPARWRRRVRRLHRQRVAAVVRVERDVGARGDEALLVPPGFVEVEERVLQALRQQHVEALEVRRRSLRLHQERPEAGPPVALALRHVVAAGDVQHGHRVRPVGDIRHRRQPGRGAPVPEAVVVEPVERLPRELVGADAPHQRLLDEGILPVVVRRPAAGVALRLADGAQRQVPHALADIAGVQAVAQVVPGDVRRDRIQPLLAVHRQQQQLVAAAVAAALRPHEQVGPVGHADATGRSGNEVPFRLVAPRQVVQVPLGPVEDLYQVLALELRVHHAHGALGVAEAARIP